MTEVQIRDEFIRLGQALKLSGAASSGTEAKFLIGEGLVCVNGEVECRRGRKLYKGDCFSFEHQEYRIVAL